MSAKVRISLPSTPPSSLHRFLRKFVSAGVDTISLAGRNRFWWNCILVFWDWENYNPAQFFVSKNANQSAINSSELPATIPSKTRLRGCWYYFSGRKKPFLMKLYFGLFFTLLNHDSIANRDRYRRLFCAFWQRFCFVFIRFPSKSVCEALWCPKTWYFLLRNEYNCVVCLNRILTFEFSGHVLTISGSKKRQRVDFHR